MKRFDLYGTVHKSIRALLFDAALLVARTDFTAAEGRNEATRRIRRLLGFLDEHAEHEDEVLMPEIAAISPELEVQLRSDHARIDGLQRDLLDFVERLEDASDAERCSIGLRIHERMGRLVAEQLLHVDREETLANRAFWAHRTDEQLRELEGRIVGGIPPARLAEWFEVMLPAMNPSERSELLDGLRKAMPEDAFRELTGVGS